MIPLLGKLHEIGNNVIIDLFFLIFPLCLGLTFFLCFCLNFCDSLFLLMTRLSCDFDLLFSLFFARFFIHQYLCFPFILTDFCYHFWLIFPSPHSLSSYLTHFYFYVILHFTLCLTPFPSSILYPFSFYLTPCALLTSHFIFPSPHTPFSLHSYCTPSSLHLTTISHFCFSSLILYPLFP